MIALTWPLAPWSGVAVAAVCAVVGGYAAGGIMNTALRVWGHKGYVSESYEQRAARQYMDKAKQGMRD